MDFAVLLLFIAGLGSTVGVHLSNGVGNADFEDFGAPNGLLVCHTLEVHRSGFCRGEKFAMVLINNFCSHWQLTHIARRSGFGESVR